MYNLVLWRHKQSIALLNYLFNVGAASQIDQRNLSTPSVTLRS